MAVIAVSFKIHFAMCELRVRYPYTFLNGHFKSFFLYQIRPQSLSIVAHAIGTAKHQPTNRQPKVRKGLDVSVRLHRLRATHLNNSCTTVGRKFLSGHLPYYAVRPKDHLTSE